MASSKPRPKATVKYYENVGGYAAKILVATCFLKVRLDTKGPNIVFG